jgi:carboxyl-terminal processing protease
MVFSLDKHKKMVKNYLIAEFTRQLYDEEKYYSMILKNDPMILEVLKKNNKM